MIYEVRDNSQVPTKVEEYSENFVNKYGRRMSAVSESTFETMLDVDTTKMSCGHITYIIKEDEIQKAESRYV